MAYLDDVEYKAVKRNKFGPIDVYPQEERQKEVKFYFWLMKKNNKK